MKFCCNTRKYLQVIHNEHLAIVRHFLEMKIGMDQLMVLAYTNLQ